MTRTTETFIIRQTIGIDSYYTVMGYAIDVNEAQDCNPAVRDLPHTTSQYLDDATYVLSPRELRITLRLNDREKAVLNQIFAYLETDFSTNLYTELWLITSDGINAWHYTGFIKEQSSKWEYHIENGRKARWWEIEISCDVKTSTLEIYSGP